MNLWEKPKVIKIYTDRVVLEDEETEEAWEVKSGADIAFIKQWFDRVQTVGEPLA